MPTAAKRKPTRKTARRTTSPGDEASTREKILDVALQSFAELGFDGSSTRSIATTAGVNQGLIPYYFGSKEKLWKEAVERAFARISGDVLGDVLRPAQPDESQADRLARAIRRYVAFVAAHPEFVKLMNEEGKRESKRMRWLVDTHVRPLQEGLAKLHEQASRERGLKVGVPTMHAHYIFAGAVSEIFHQAPECRRLFGVDPGDPAVAEAHADALIQLFLGDARLGKDPEAPRRPRRKS